MESQHQNPEFRNNPENFHLCTCNDTIDLQKKEYYTFLNLLHVTPKNIQWTILTFLNQTLWKIPLVYKGLKGRTVAQLVGCWTCDQKVKGSYPIPGRVCCVLEQDIYS